MGGYDAALIDLDGTLVEGADGLLEENVAALRAAEARGKRVMIATGRSTVSTRPVLERLGLETPALVFNGAGLWCQRRARMLEERKGKVPMPQEEGGEGVEPNPGNPSGAEAPPPPAKIRPDDRAQGGQRRKTADPGQPAGGGTPR